LIEGLRYSQQFLADIARKVEREEEIIDDKIERTSKRMLSIVSQQIENRYDVLIKLLYDLPPSLGLLTYLSRFYFDCEVLLVLGD
jgi:hypothetical protein